MVKYLSITLSGVIANNLIGHNQVSQYSCFCVDLRFWVAIPADAKWIFKFSKEETASGLDNMFWFELYVMNDTVTLSFRYIYEYSKQFLTFIVVPT